MQSRIIKQNRESEILTRFFADVSEKSIEVVTAHRCEQELRFSLEGWLIVKIRHDDKLPVIGKINLNKKMLDIQGATAHW